MASPFDNWNFQDAQIAAQLSTDRAGELDAYRKFADGDHFQDWEGWIGPTPDTSDEDAARVRDEIERGFVSRNVLAEVIGRATNGVLGRNVKYSVTPARELAEGETPTPDEQARINEATALLKEWVTARKLDQEYDTLCENLLIAGIAYQRPFVAPGEVDADGVVPSGDLATSLNRVYVSYPLPGEAVVYTDPRTQQKCSIYLYKEMTSSRPSELADETGEPDRAELTYLDGDKTIIRIVGGSDDEAVDYSYPLGKRLLMSDLRRRPLINPQVVSQQKLLNLALTMKERNVILGGFLERVATNAQMDGHYETQADGTKKFVYDPLPVGAGALTTLTGYILTDAEGNESIANPNMLWRDPVPVSTFLDTERSAYHAILSECNQLHYAMSDDATASGTSRETAMAAYLIDLLQTKQQIDLGWSWLLETALTLAAVLSGEADYFADLKVSAEASVDPGPITADMIRVVIDLWREDRLSHKTGLTWIGVSDPEAEIATLDQERTERADRFPELSEAEREFDRDLFNQIDELEMGL